MTEDSISILDLIIDVPGYIDLRAVTERLKYATINGHPVLHVQQSAIHRNDAIDIPHAGHSHSCMNSPESCDGQRLASGHRFKRYFFVQAIVDGAFRIADMEHVDFRLEGALVIVSCVNIRVQPDEFNRVALVPAWTKEKE